MFLGYQVKYSSAPLRCWPLRGRLDCKSWDGCKLRSVFARCSAPLDLSLFAVSGFQKRGARGTPEKPLKQNRLTAAGLLGSLPSVALSFPAFFYIVCSAAKLKRKIEKEAKI